MNNNQKNNKPVFSLHEIVKPKFNLEQIKIDMNNSMNHAGLPKSRQKLIVKKNGKIEFTK